jgi:hypothetical protein
MVPDSIKTFTYTVRMAVTQDTIITSGLWIGKDSALFILPPWTVQFDNGASLILNGGALVIGSPSRAGLPGYYSLREQHADCECDQGPRLTAGPNNTTWGGLLIKAQSTVFIRPNAGWSRRKRHLNSLDTELRSFLNKAQRS